MPTITELRAQREALIAQLASRGVRVSDDGKPVDCCGSAEVDRAVEALGLETPQPDPTYRSPNHPPSSFFKPTLIQAA